MLARCPDLLIALDPDSTRTALAAAMLDGAVYKLTRLEGGGRGPLVPWTTITGAKVWLDLQLETLGLAPKQVTVVVETQAAHSPHSPDVEALRRTRYHWDAACELLGICCVHVDLAWQRHCVDFSAHRGQAAIKKAIRAWADAKCDRVRNQDQADALGILDWYATIKLGKGLDAR